MEQDAISVLAEQSEAAKLLSEELSENIAVEVQAQLGAAAGEDVLVVAEGDTPQNDTPQGDTNPPGGETVPPSDGSNSEIPLAGWFIADIPQVLAKVKEEFQRQGVTAEIVTTYEEYRDSTLRKLGGESTAPFCWDDCYISYSPGRPCGEEMVESSADTFVQNAKYRMWDVYEENPEIIAVVFDHYDGIDTDWDRVDDAREIWLKIYF